MSREWVNHKQPMVSFGRIKSRCSSTRSYQNLFSLTTPSEWLRRNWAKIHQGRFVHLYFCRFLFIFNVFDIAFISVILTAGLFYSGKPAQYKCYKGFMVSCLSIQPCHVNSSLNLAVKIFWMWKWRRSVFVFQNWSVVLEPSLEWSIYCSLFVLHRELINKYLEFHSSALSLLKKITVVLKFRLHFHTFSLIS